jgi:hypothetical protein
VAKKCKICKKYTVTGAGKKVTPVNGQSIQPVCDSCAGKQKEGGASVAKANESKPTTSADIAPGPGPEPGPKPGKKKKKH